MDGVAEDRVRVGEADTGEGGDFAFVGGDVEQGVGDDAVGDGYLGCEDAGGFDAEAANAFFDDPVAGGTDGPDLDAAELEFADEDFHLGEDVAFDLGGEEFGRGGAEVGLAEAGVDLDHLATDFEFGDLAGEIAAVADVEAGDGFGGEDALLDSPAHEAGAGVAGPEGSIAVEDGDDRIEVQNRGVEFSGGENGGGGDVGGQWIPSGGGTPLYIHRFTESKRGYGDVYIDLSIL